MKKFRIGDKVVAVDEIDGVFPTTGVTGTVVCFYPSGEYGVVFDKYNGGHSLEGRCADGYGLWCQESYIVLVKRKEPVVDKEYESMLI